MRILLTVIVLAAAGGAAWWYLGDMRDHDAAATYRTAAVTRGPLQMTVVATGKVNPVVTVDVGSQVSGQVAELHVDFNAEVAAEQVIARLDPATFAARVRIARADLDVARATLVARRAALAEVRAELLGADAGLKEAASDLQRARSLRARDMVAEDAVDKALTARDQARARRDGAAAKLTRQQAEIDVAAAQAAGKEAALLDRELELERTVIRSPVRGTVIGRNVDVGQTVAASLQAPVLFTIARDLASMQVEVSIDEADIGRVREGQQVTFAVDAYPGRTFRGEVAQVRLAPVEVANVVTYTVVVSAANGERLLLPGMTANVEVIVGAREEALRVPNAALRYRPAGSATDAPAGDAPRAGGPEAARQRMEENVAQLTERVGLDTGQQQAVRTIFMEIGQQIRGLREQGLPREQMRETVQRLRAQAGPRIEPLLNDAQRRAYRLLQAERAAGGNRRGRLWVPGDDGVPRAVDVVLGLADGNATELVRGALAAGDLVIVGETAER